MPRQTEATHPGPLLLADYGLAIVPPQGGFFFWGSHAALYGLTVDSTGERDAGGASSGGCRRWIRAYDSGGSDLPARQRAGRLTRDVVRQPRVLIFLMSCWSSHEPPRRGMERQSADPGSHGANRPQQRSPMQKAPKGALHNTNPVTGAFRTETPGSRRARRAAPYSTEGRLSAF